MSRSASHYWQGDATLSLSKWFRNAFKEKEPRRQYWDHKMFGLKQHQHSGFLSFSDAIENLVNDRGARIAEGSAKDDTAEVDRAKLWVPLYDTSKRTGNSYEERGKLLVSIELVPEAEVEKLPAGAGRKEPNTNPFLPKPVGRLHFSWNPFSIISQFLGPALCRRLWCLICLAALAAIAYNIVPVLGGNLIWEPWRKLLD